MASRVLVRQRWWQRTYTGKAFEHRMQGAFGMSAFLLFCGLPLGYHLISSEKRKNQKKGKSDRKQVIQDEILKKIRQQKEDPLHVPTNLGSPFRKLVPVSLTMKSEKEKAEEAKLFGRK